MDAPAAALLDALEPEPLLARVIERTRALDPAPHFDEDTTRQFVHGFLAIVREAAEGRSTGARELYTAGAANAVAQQGRTAASLGRSLVTFGVVVGAELARALPDEERVAALEWLARFLGEWTEELLEATAGAMR